MEKHLIGIHQNNLQEFYIKEENKNEALKLLKNLIIIY